MISSLWRYIHLVLAIIASLFFALAALTGIIIAVNKLSNENIIELLTENNYKKLIDVICENGYIN